MSKKDDLKDFNEIKLNFKKKIKNITGESKTFPKYTTQVINLANQNAQGTRPQVGGNMSNLIQQCPTKTYEGWKKWYLESHPT